MVSIQSGHLDSYHHRRVRALLPHAPQWLVHGNGLRVIVIVVKRFWWGLPVGKIAGDK